jgi:hypothetical protein
LLSMRCFSFPLKTAEKTIAEPAPRHRLRHLSSSGSTPGRSLRPRVLPSRRTVTA